MRLAIRTLRPQAEDKPETWEPPRIQLCLVCGYAGARLQPQVRVALRARSIIQGHDVKSEAATSCEHAGIKNLPIM